MSLEGFLWLGAFVFLAIVYKDDMPTAGFFAVLSLRLGGGLVQASNRVKELETSNKALWKRIEDSIADENASNEDSTDS